ncbi:MAG: PhzF family phenazine biosynthesis protein [Anaerolineaceae bacterium]
MKLYQVDAFTTVPFKGNPAGVCVLDAAADEDWMRNVAMEMNLSETAFLVPENEGWHLRWFTPKREVSLCGHATLASAHILWETGRLAPDATARFYTKSSELTAVKHGDWITLNFPAREIYQDNVTAELARALAIPSPVFTGRNEDRWLVELEDENQVRGLQPDFSSLASLPVRSVMVTARAVAPYDFVSRYFAPSVGVNEDPVTGSSHTYLTPYWIKKLGKAELCAYQASTRGGELRLRMDGGRVLIAGRAVTFFEAEMKN